MKKSIFIIVLLLLSCSNVFSLEITFNEDFTQRIITAHHPILIQSSQNFQKIDVIMLLLQYEAYAWNELGRQSAESFGDIFKEGLIPIFSIGIFIRGDVV